MTHTTTLAVAWEAAHRLPHLPGKCTSLHGHSWTATVDVTFDATDVNDIGVEFAEYKHVLRQWVDAQFDHGAILGAADPLVPALRAEGCKVYRIGNVDNATVPEKHAMNRRWPTVETVAMVLARAAEDALSLVPHVPGAYVSAVTVRETANNAHTYRTGDR